MIHWNNELLDSQEKWNEEALHVLIWDDLWNRLNDKYEQIHVHAHMYKKDRYSSGDVSLGLFFLPWHQSHGLNLESGDCSHRAGQQVSDADWWWSSKP